MKLLAGLSLSITILAVSAFGQHSVVTKFVDPNVPTTGNTYNVYRTPALAAGTTCPTPSTSAVLPATPVFTKLNGAPLTAPTYGDTSVVGGATYCYLASIVNSAGVESCSPGLTNCGTGNPVLTMVIPPDPKGPAPATNLTGVAKDDDEDPD